MSSSAGQVEQAFGIKLASYRLGDRTGYANLSSPRLPAAIAVMSRASSALTTWPRCSRSSYGPPRGNSGSGDGPSGRPRPRPGARAIAKASNNAKTSGGLTANVLARIYQFTGLYKAHDFGQGVNVAVVEFGEPNLPGDINAYLKCYNIHTKVGYDKVDGFHQKGPGQGEAALDIETIAGLAPDAKITVYQSPNTGAAVYDVYRTFVDQDRVRVISASYGLCEHYEDPPIAH